MTQASPDMFFVKEEAQLRLGRADLSSDNNDEEYLLQKMQTMLEGIPPPPSLAVCKMTCTQMLDSWNLNNHLHYVGAPVHEQKELCFNGTPKVNFLNTSNASEQIAELSMKFVTRFVQFETASSYTFWREQEKKCNSARKRRIYNGVSPGRRLSHLARRRQIFSRANLQQMSHQETKNLIAVRTTNNGSRNVVKDFVNLKPNTVHLNLPKRALFQSPDEPPVRAGYRTVPRQVPRRRLFESAAENSDHGLPGGGGSYDVSGWLASQPFAGGRKRNRDDSYESDRKRRCPRRSLDFSEGSTSCSNEPPIDTLEDPKPSVPLPRTRIANLHRQKLLWVVATVLKEKKITIMQKIFKPCAIYLFNVCRDNLQNILSVNDKRRTSEKILEFARNNVNDAISKFRDVDGCPKTVLTEVRSSTLNHDSETRQSPFKGKENVTKTPKRKICLNKSHSCRKATEPRQGKLARCNSLDDVHEALNFVASDCVKFRLAPAIKRKRQPSVESVPCIVDATPMKTYMIRKQNYSVVEETPEKSDNEDSTPRKQDFLTVAIQDNSTNTSVIADSEDDQEVLQFPALTKYQLDNSLVSFNLLKPEEISQEITNCDIYCPSSVHLSSGQINVAKSPHLQTFTTVGQDVDFVDGQMNLKLYNKRIAVRDCEVDSNFKKASTYVGECKLNRTDLNETNDVRNCKMNRNLLDRSFDDDDVGDCEINRNLKENNSDVGDVQNSIMFKDGAVVGIKIKDENVDVEGCQMKIDTKGKNVDFVCSQMDNSFVGLGRINQNELIENEICYKSPLIFDKIKGNFFCTPIKSNDSRIGNLTTTPQKIASVKNATFDDDEVISERSMSVAVRCNGTSGCIEQNNLMQLPENGVVANVENSNSLINFKSPTCDKLLNECVIDVMCHSSIDTPTKGALSEVQVEHRAALGEKTFEDLKSYQRNDKTACSVSAIDFPGVADANSAQIDDLCTSTPLLAIKKKLFKRPAWKIEPGPGLKMRVRLSKEWDIVGRSALDATISTNTSNESSSCTNNNFTPPIICNTTGNKSCEVPPNNVNGEKPAVAPLVSSPASSIESYTLTELRDRMAIERTLQYDESEFLFGASDSDCETTDEVDESSEVKESLCFSSTANYASPNNVKSETPDFGVQFHKICFPQASDSLDGEMPLSKVSVCNTSLNSRRKSRHPKKNVTNSRNCENVDNERFLLSPIGLKTPKKDVPPPRTSIIWRTPSGSSFDPIGKNTTPACSPLNLTKRRLNEPDLSLNQLYSKKDPRGVAFEPRDLNSPRASETPFQTLRNTPEILETSLHEKLDISHVALNSPNCEIGLGSPHVSPQVCFENEVNFLNQSVGSEDDLQRKNDVSASFISCNQETTNVEQFSELLEDNTVSILENSCQGSYANVHLSESSNSEERCGASISDETINQLPSNNEEISYRAAKENKFRLSLDAYKARKKIDIDCAEEPKDEKPKKIHNIRLKKRRPKRHKSEEYYRNQMYGAIHASSKSDSGEFENYIENVEKVKKAFHTITSTVEQQMKLTVSAVSNPEKRFSELRKLNQVHDFTKGLLQQFTNMHKKAPVHSP